MRGCGSADAVWKRYLARQRLPGGAAVVTAPNLTLRGFSVPPTRAAAVQLVALDNQCTGYAGYAGEQDNDPTAPTDCTTGRTADDRPRRGAPGVLTAETGFPAQRRRYARTPSALCCSASRPAQVHQPADHPRPLAGLEIMVGRIPIANVTPLVDLGRQPAKATVGEPLPVTATVFREGPRPARGRVVLIGPDGQRRPPARMTKHAEIPDHYAAWVTPDAVRAWSFGWWPGPTRCPPGSTMPASRSPRGRRRADVHRGRPAAGQVLASLDPRPRLRQCRPGAAAGARGRPRHQPPPEARLAVLESPGDRRPPPPPDPRAAHRRGPPTRRTPTGSVRFVQQLVRFFPAPEGATVDPQDRQGHQWHLPDRRQTVGRGGGDGIRHRLPAADPTDRRGQPLGRNNTLDPGPDDTGSPWAIGSRHGGHDAIHPTWAPSGTSTPSSGAPGTSGSGRLDLAPCRRPRTTRGSRPTRWFTTRRRDDRLRGEPAEEVPGHLPGQLRQRPDRHLPGGAAHRPALDVARRAGLPGRQPAPSRSPSGVAAARGPADRPDDALPGRGPSPARR